MTRPAIAVVVLAIVPIACAEPLEFADWTMPVAAGTRIIEYDGVPVADRTERIAPVRDLVIGGEGEDLRSAFYNASDVAVAADGRIYVHDNGNHRIQVFDGAGNYVRTIGQEGQGPGEIGGGGSLEVVGDRLIRNGDRRLRVWSLDGEFLGDEPVQDGKRLFNPVAFNDGSLLAGYLGARVDGQPIYVRPFVVARVSADGALGRTYAEMRHASALFTLVGRGGGAYAIRAPGEAAGFAATADGSIYLAPGSEYQVRALDLDGTHRWALRVAWQRVPLSESHKAAAIIQKPEDAGAIDIDDFVDWPELNPALANGSRADGHRPLVLDGHGNIWVFPWVEQDDGRAEWPVDAYSPDGARLFAGITTVDGWAAALGDFIYRLEEHPETGEQQVVRYRLSGL